MLKKDTNCIAQNILCMLSSNIATVRIDIEPIILVTGTIIYILLVRGQAVKSMCNPTLRQKHVYAKAEANTVEITLDIINTIPAWLSWF